MSFQALYRKYRPQRFGELVGQDHITTALRNAVRDDPDRVTQALEDPAFVAWFSDARPHDELKRFPPGYPQDHPLARPQLFHQALFNESHEDVLIDRRVKGAGSQNSPVVHGRNGA